MTPKLVKTALPTQQKQKSWVTNYLVESDFANYSSFASSKEPYKTNIARRSAKIDNPKRQVTQILSIFLEYIHFVYECKREKNQFLQ